MENPAKTFWNYTKAPKKEIDPTTTQETTKGIIMINDTNSVETIDNDTCFDDDLTVVDEQDLVFIGRAKKKPKNYFDGGTYLTNSPSFRDGWTKVDWDFYAALVTIKVQRKNRKNQIPVLDDIVEFRMLPTKEANDLCDKLFAMDYVFVVYEGDKVREKNNVSQ